MANPIIGGKTRLLNWESGVHSLLVCGGLLTFVTPSPVFADDWGCQVLLCLADPRGPETESECKPPIEKLWNALEHGKPFPTCDLNSSVADLPPDVRSSLPVSALNADQATGAQNVGADQTTAAQISSSGVHPSKACSHAALVAQSTSPSTTSFTHVCGGESTAKRPSPSSMGKGRPQSPMTPPHLRNNFCQ